MKNQSQFHYIRPVPAEFKAYNDSLTEEEKEEMSKRADEIFGELFQNLGCTNVNTINK